MRRLQTGIAVLCVFLMLAPVAGAQQIQYVQDQPGGPFSGLTRPYSTKQIAPVDLANSTRLDSLLRAGNIYLSLQDAIALALENNLDIQIQRYTRPSMEASLLRAKAGGPLRGVPTSVQNLTTSSLSSITGGAYGTAGSSSGGGISSTQGAGAGGTIIQATGTSIPSFDPSFYVYGGWGHHTTPQLNSFTTGVPTLITRNDTYASGFQTAFASGTQASLQWYNSRSTSNTGVALLNPANQGQLSLNVTQPLLRGFGLAVNNRNITIAKNNVQVGDLIFKQQVISTVSQVISGYWDLVSSSENVKVKQQALDVARKLYEDNKKQVEIGTLAPIEIVKAEAEVANYEQQLVLAQTTLLQVETALKNALSKTGVANPAISEAHIIPTDRITVPDTEPVIPVQDLVANAMESRPELAQSRINIESQKIGLKGSKSQLMPELDLVGNLVNSGLAGQANGIPSPYPIAPADPFYYGGIGTVFSQLFARNFPDYSLGVQLIVPLRNRSAQADYILDSLSLRQMELQNQRLLNSIRLDVRNALIAVQQAGASYKAAVKARELAEQTLDAEQKKYALGASTIFFVIQYQRDLAAARSTEVTAQSQYAKAKVQLDQATGKTLDAYNISIDEARKGTVSRPPSAPIGPNQK